MVMANWCGLAQTSLTGVLPKFHLIHKTRPMGPGGTGSIRMFNAFCFLFFLDPNQRLAYLAEHEIFDEIYYL